MPTTENYTTQHVTNMLNQLMAATKKGDITREACEEAKNCAAAIIIQVSIRFENVEAASLEEMVGDDVALGAMPALKPLFDSVEANQSAVIIAEAKRIRAELEQIRLNAVQKSSRRTAPVLDSMQPEARWSCNMTHLKKSLYWRKSELGMHAFSSSNMIKRRMSCAGLL